MLVQPGYDGVVIDRQGRVVRESCYFSNIWRQQALAGQLDLAIDEIQLDSLFVSFDSAWANYYHWISFGIGPAAVAKTALDPSIPIAIPDYNDRVRFQAPAFSREVYDQSLDHLRLGTRLHRLKQGLYKVKRAYVVHVKDGEPNNLAVHAAFIDAYRQIASQVTSAPPTRRTFVSRLKQGANGRITPGEDADIERWAAKRGFTKVFLENLSFNDQVKLFAESAAILAPTAQASSTPSSPAPKPESSN